MKIIVLVNYLISFLVIYLKILYGNLHGHIANLMQYDVIDKKLISKITGNNSEELHVVMVLAAISIVLSVVIVNKKICGRYIAIINILLAITSLLLVVVPF